MLDISQHPQNEPARVIIGAGEQNYAGWIATGKEQLDLLCRDDWVKSFGERRADAFLAEHVWEHLTEAGGRKAAEYCFASLIPGGYLHCAVPDGHFPDPDYQQLVRVGGPGPADHPAAGHKILYDYRLLSDVFEAAGFEVDLLEYCDERGRFHYNQWDPREGPIYRSLLQDHRNEHGEIRFVSLIIHAKKPSS
jgi:predicted SAM-dependent methyltransferase